MSFVFALSHLHLTTPYCCDRSLHSVSIKYRFAFTLNFCVYFYLLASCYLAQRAFYYAFVLLSDYLSFARVLFCKQMKE